MSEDLIIHNECGLDIELCACPNSDFYWDNEEYCIKKRSKNENPELLEEE